MKELKVNEGTNPDLDHAAQPSAFPPIETKPSRELKAEPKMARLTIKDWIALTTALGATPDITPADLAHKAGLLTDSRRILNRKLHSFDELVSALEDTLQMAEKYLSGAPSHPDNAKLEDARAVLTKVREK